MELIEHCVGNAVTGEGIAVRIPVLGVGCGHIQNHGPFAVDTGGLGVGVAGFADVTIHHHQIGVVDAIQIADALRDPSAVNVAAHMLLKQQIIRMRGAAAVEIDGHILGSGCPKAEGGLARAPDGTQIMTGIGKFFLEFVGRVDSVHGDGTPFYHNGNKSCLNFHADYTIVNNCCKANL